MRTKLSGTAFRLARVEGSIATAVAQLRELATSRTADVRRDLRAEEAGLLLAAYSMRIETGDRAVAAGLLIMAGADNHEVARWVEIGRQRMSEPKHSI